MEKLIILVQLALSISVMYVWIFRYHNVLKEFEQFGLNDITRNIVGATKISLSTLLIVSISHSSLIFIPSILMGLLMISAQYFHFKIKNPISKRIPSLILLILCVFLALTQFNKEEWI